MMRLRPDFRDIVSHFCLEGEFVSAAPCGFGHINDTYAVEFRLPGGEFRRYPLQRVNSHVFRNIAGLMRNMEAVTGHLRSRIAAAGGNSEREVLTLIPCVDGNTFHTTLSGEFWRAFVFIEGARTYEVSESREHIYQVGRAFGHFQQLLADFPAVQLVETIPGFHHTARRFGAFARAVQRDVVNRAHTARPEIEFVEARAEEMPGLLRLLDSGTLPSRVTHNDTKLNNVMIDDITGEGICVIDLDTVMPGSALYDFGDAVRYAANPAAEDERDLSKVCIDLEIYACLARGFLDAARGLLTPEEVDYLPFSAKLMTLECGMRFLTDYLEGDVYFKTSREGHNLDRCRTQLKMVADMEAKLEQMERIVALHR